MSAFLPLLEQERTYCSKKSGRRGLRSSVRSGENCVSSAGYCSKNGPFPNSSATTILPELTPNCPPILDDDPPCCPAYSAQTTGASHARVSKQNSIWRPGRISWAGWSRAGNSDRSPKPTLNMCGILEADRDRSPEQDGRADRTSRPRRLH